MEINIQKLRNHQIGSIEINELVEVPSEYYCKTDVRSLEPVKTVGKITRLGEDFEVSFELEGTMILPCSITLEDVKYPFKTTFSEIITQNDPNYFEKSQNTLDILPILWQNIVVEIPMKVTIPNLKNKELKGSNWKLVTDEEKEVDPRLAKLQDFLKD